MLSKKVFLFMGRSTHLSQQIGLDSQIKIPGLQLISNCFGNDTALVVKIAYAHDENKLLDCLIAFIVLKLISNFIFKSVSVEFSSWAHEGLTPTCNRTWILKKT